MEIIKALEKLLAIANNLRGLPHDRKVRVVASLKYLLKQAQCEFDRKDSDQNLKACWRQLSQDVAGTVICEHRAAMTELKRFVGAPVEPQKPEKFANLTLEKFFGDLSEVVRRTRPVRGSDCTLLYFSLTTLHDQAKKPPGDRDQQIIQRTWNAVLTLSGGTKIFEPYQGEGTLRHRLKEFLKPKKTWPSDELVAATMKMTTPWK